MNRDANRNGPSVQMRTPPRPNPRCTGPLPGLRDRPGLRRRIRRALIEKWRRATAKARLGPSFLIIGAQKCGTTALFDLLATHPLVLPPVRRSVHFLDDFYHLGPHWYRSHFPLKRPGFRVTGEVSPSYLMHPLAPGRAAALDPRMKLIAILRDPVERALSHHAMSIRKGREPLPFPAAVDAEAERLSGIGEAIPDGPRYKSHSVRVHSYLRRGRYAEQLQLWLEHFLRENLLVLRTEDFWADGNRTANRVYDFLGLPPHRLPVGMFTGQRRYSIDPALRKRLDRFFADDQAKLKELFDYERMR